jgi:transcriptional regulator with XRE-family HTH domain
MALGDRLKQQRETRRYSQAVLADLAQIDQAMISRLERKMCATINSAALKRLAQALGCTTDWLVGMHEENEESERLTTVAL